MKAYQRIIIAVVTVVFGTALILPCAAIQEENAQPQELPREAILASLWEADISAIREAYAQNLITCIELTAYYLERIEEYNDIYNCFITLCDDALEQAALRDEEMLAGESDGSLLGIPIVIKDNIDYAGYHTTNGYSKNNSNIASTNAAIVDYMLQEGAVIIGKSNMSAGAQDHRASYSVAVGETKNAYSPYLASGGSSGGSAVAVSLNFAVAGLGTDTNSSLRLPAALNGCVSLRATRHTLSTDGIVKLNSAKDVPGVITRTVMDQAICLDVLSGGETNYAQNLNGEVLSGLRIGILTEFSGANMWGRNEKNIDAEIIAAFENAVEELRQCGAEVVEVSIPDVFYLAEATYESSSYIDRMYAKVEKAIEEAQVSALIFPSYLSTPIRTGYDENGKYWYTYDQTMLNNTSKFSSCAGLPEIVVPIGNHSLGAGIGMEIAALKNQEQLLLDIAYAYTQRYDHRMAPENAPDLYAQYYSGSVYDIIDILTAPIDVPEQSVPEESIEETEPVLPSDETAETDPESEVNGSEANHWPVLVICGCLSILLISMIFCFVRKNRKRQKSMSIESK